MVHKTQNNGDYGATLLMVYGCDWRPHLVYDSCETEVQLF